MNKTETAITMFLISFWLLAACCFLIPGCGSAPPKLPDANMKAVELNQKAESAYKNGHYKAALNLYSEALKISRSIEHIDGIAINLVSMATVYRKIGDWGNAHKCADEILNSPHFAFSPPYISNAAFIKAALYTDEGTYPTAVEWTDRALQSCSDEKCADKGRIYNLKAKIALLCNEPKSALAYAMRGLDLNRKLNDRQEEANSLRLIADAKTLMNEYENAKKSYEDALSIDKDMGLDRKIAMDLIGLGNVFFKQGRYDDALGYFKRALSVSKALDDNQGVKDISELIEKCIQLSGKK